MQASLREVITIDADGVARLTDLDYFQVHVCTQDDLDRRALERAQYVPGSSHLLEEVAVPCPRCGAEIGERCRPLTDRYKFGNHLMTAHPARSKAAGL